MKDGTYRYYAGSMVYNHEKKLDYLLTGEGMVTKTSTVFTYEYHLKYHLGNTRVTFQPNGTTTILTQATEYYPFGMNYPQSPGGTNKYLYNSKEKQDDQLSGTNLDLYDYGAKYYDAQITRWHSVDPLAEKGRRWSPYTYCFNNPIRFIDPDGMCGDDYSGYIQNAFPSYRNWRPVSAFFKDLSADGLNALVIGAIHCDNGEFRMEKMLLVRLDTLLVNNPELSEIRLEIGEQAR